MRSACSNIPVHCIAIAAFLAEIIWLAIMTQVCLLDSARLSSLLEDALDWNDTTDSIMVSANNGSVLATAFRHKTPQIKDLRTLSTTLTAAYTVASEDVLVFEAQATRAISVIRPVADHILLAVNGPLREEEAETSNENEMMGINGNNEDSTAEEDEAGAADEGSDSASALAQALQTRTELEGVSEELASVLRKELSGLVWPNDI
jgi:hypothetical protein